MLLVIVALALAVSGNAVNKKVDRTLDLTTHLVRETVVLTLENTGAAALTQYTLPSDPALTPSFVSVKSGNDELQVNGNVVSLNVKAGASVTLEIKAVYANAQIPFPAQITQDEVQYVKFTGNVYWNSEFPTKTQTTIVKVAGPTQSFTKQKPFKSADKSITYGPYENIATNSHAELSVHFETKTPFLTTTNLVREIEVSHWGNVAVTEDITVKHTGANLKGSFSRLNFQRNPAASRNSIKSFDTQLPAAAVDVYYRDVIGNISTSNLRVSSESSLLQLRPRFPLFGGWKTQYTVGYNLPSYEVLSRDGSNFALNIRFVDHIYDDMAINQAEIRVILPEHASNIQVNAPFALDSQSETVRFTYLDYSGRPVLILKKSNLVEEHMQDFEVTYTFSQSNILLEPIYLIIFFAVLLFGAIFFNRLDLSVEPTVQEKVKTQ